MRAGPARRDLIFQPGAFGLTLILIRSSFPSASGLVRAPLAALSDHQPPGFRDRWLGSAATLTARSA